MMNSGTVLTKDGTTVSLPNISTPELQKMEALSQQGASQSQIEQQVYTTNGDTLSDALQLVQTAINLHGGAANPNVPNGSALADSYVKSLVSGSDLQTILNGGSSSGSSSTSNLHYSQGTSQSSGDSMNLASPGVLIPFAIIVLPLFAALFFSHPELPYRKGTNPNQRSFS